MHKAAKWKIAIKLQWYIPVVCIEWPFTLYLSGLSEQLYINLQLLKYSAFKLLINVSVFFCSLIACQVAMWNVLISDMLYCKCTALCIYLILPWLKPLFVSFLKYMPRINTRAFNVGFVLYRVTLSQPFSKYLGFPLSLSLYRCSRHTPLFI
jgi:hypothetical protein